MLAFFPWARIDESFDVGAFRVAPVGEAMRAAPADVVLAARAVLATHGTIHPVSQDQIPLVFQADGNPTAVMSEDVLPALFRMGELLAFAALAKREYFSQRYWNRASFRLVVQGFQVGAEGGVLITARRRDGSSQHVISTGRDLVPRPAHAAQVELGAVTDGALLAGLVASQGKHGWDLTMDALLAFNASNTDGPDVTQEQEIVMIVGAFSRLFGVWKERETVERFAAILPGNARWDEEHYGPKANGIPLVGALAKGSSVRREWMRDAYMLRNQYAHGSQTPLYRPAWSLRDHLLLASFIFPLTVKCRLAETGAYGLTEADRRQIDAFDTLATFDHILQRESDDYSNWPWSQILFAMHGRRWVAGLKAQPSAPDAVE